MNDIANTPRRNGTVMGINLNACYFMCHSVPQHMLREKRLCLNVRVSREWLYTKCPHLLLGKRRVINLTRAMANAYGKLASDQIAFVWLHGYSAIADVIDIFEDEQTADASLQWVDLGLPKRWHSHAFIWDRTRRVTVMGSFCRLMGVQWLDNRIVILLYFSNYLLIGYPLLLLKMSRCIFQLLPDFFHITIYFSESTTFPSFPLRIAPPDQLD